MVQVNLESIRLVFCPQVVAETTSPTENAWMISIVDPGCPEADLEDGWKQILRLRFHDIESRTEGFVEFSWQQARETIRFITQAKKEGVRELWVHCRAGSSRSAAIALVAARILNTKVQGDASGYNKMIRMKCFLVSLIRGVL